MEATQLTIRMADNEWAGSNPAMIDIAKEALLKAKDGQFGEVPNLVVTVQEHAGWWLMYTLNDNNEVVCVGTANDMATISDERRRFWERVKDAKWTYLPEIKRNNK